MAGLNATFIFGILILLYLSSFILFALVRITTGISIQRFGYLSLRRITYIPKDGVRIEIRSVGLLLHRPTFAQPTWLSLVLHGAQVTVDLEKLDGSDIDVSGVYDGVVERQDKSNGASVRALKGRGRQSRRFDPHARRSRTWERLSNIKEKIARVHRKIHWLRILDVIATNSTCTIVDVGYVQVGSLTMAVDMRRKTNMLRIFGHGHSMKKNQRPAEWMFTLRSAFFRPDGKDAVEILDQCSLNIHGMLYQDKDGLRDATIALKLGRVHIPYDDFRECAQRVQNRQLTHARTNSVESELEISLPDLMEELKIPDTHEKNLMQTISDSKEFVSSILRGIEEFQFAVSYIRMTKEVHWIQPAGRPLVMNLSMKEVAMDLHRLDPKSPAHRMYFSSTDISHQALLAAIGVSVDIDDGHQAPEQLLHVPMATTTVKTTLPSKTFQASEDRSLTDRNANILFANIVVTSPSLDLDLKHLPMLIALVRSRPSHSDTSPSRNHHLISRLLPKASVKFSVQEPVVRIALPPMELERKEMDDYDLLISSNSSIAVTIESFHSSVGEFHYSLACDLRVMSHQFYYQTALGSRYDLLLTDTLELRSQMTATPGVSVSASGKIKTFSVRLIRPEICEGLHHIVRQLNSSVLPEKLDKTVKHREHNVLRKIPSWLVQFELQGSNFSVEVAGVDDEVSKESRGLALQLDSWTAMYKGHKSEAVQKHSSRRRPPSRSLKPEDALLNAAPPSPSRRKQENSTDGRRLALHMYELEGFVIESIDVWESEPFLTLPGCEVALSSLSDAEGPVFHVNSFIRSLRLQYSLYRYYAVGIAVTVLNRMFFLPRQQNAAEPDIGNLLHQEHLSPTISEDQNMVQNPTSVRELIIVDLKASMLQVKATLPSDPSVMLQIYALDVASHRWSPPSLKAKLIRLLVDAPKIPGAWARVACTRGIRVDYRHAKRKIGLKTYEERSIDVSAEAVRLAVPHQLVTHKVSDNIVNAVKATEQLHHRFVCGTNEYVLRKLPGGPKAIPKTSFRIKALLFELEDGAFEWKLSTIYRVGLIEQTQRLAREEGFNAKVKRLKDMEQRTASGRTGSRPTFNRSVGKAELTDDFISEADDARDRQRAHLVETGCTMRYDREGKCKLSEAASISTQEAWIKLQELNAQSWRKRIDWGLKYQRNAMKDIRGMFWEADELPEGVRETETVLEYPRKPALMATTISDFRLFIDKPSFPDDSLPEFLHDVGKGMPYDTKYSLLIPMSLNVEMGESRMTLRDYPLPLVHVPAIRPTQSPRLSSWTVRTNFVIAEEFRDDESVRHVKVAIVPPEKTTVEDYRGGFAVDVRRTVSPVKTYSNLNIEIHTGYATRITWGTSYQPAIQDMMMVIETFSKPQVDPSERMGFWDKIRLGFHSRVNVAWTGDGDVHLLLKGSRDPYVVTGYGAGFVMCWRNNVRWHIDQEKDPKKFMTVDSGEYVLAIPDYTHYARQSMETVVRESDTSSSISSFKSGALFKKVIMKLTGNVQWLAGLVFERNVNGGTRSFEFIPHYDVVLKTPSFATVRNGEVYDAFRGFRSQHIHLSIAVVAPVTRDWSVSNLKPSSNYNSIHLTPRFFSHFFNWWSLFSGVMSLPIRQGSLWPGVEKSSKKFGRHLATIKYNFLLSPLFISHIYKHKDAEDYEENLVSATGLKIKLDSFMIDLHQRREELSTYVKGRRSRVRTSGMCINQAQVDFISADIRAVSASIAGTTAEDLRRASEETIASYQQSTATADISRFTIPDHDFSWIDMDDFVELDWILPAESNPETMITPLAYAPRFTYFRQTDDHYSQSGDTLRSSSFGKESTHFCVMSPDNDPRRIQRELIRERLKALEEQLKLHRRALGEAELLVIRDTPNNAAAKDQFETLQHQGHILEKHKEYLLSMLQSMSSNLQKDENLAARIRGTGHHTKDFQHNSQLERVESAPLTEFASHFSNRFIVHNAQIKWDNTLRNIILRYIHQVSQRRGFVYYMSRRAVKFIIDIVEEQKKSKHASAKNEPRAMKPPKSVFIFEQVEQSVEDRIEQLLQDAKKFVNADDPAESETAPTAVTETMGENIAQEFSPQNTFHVRFIAPQIQLRSEKNTSAAVLVTAKSVQLKVIQIMDKTRMADDVSGLVQRRFSANMNSVQVFVTNQKTFASRYLPIFSGRRYGTSASSSWPPWVPLEVMFDSEIDPFGFSRVVERTSASLRYDKYNTLRLKYNDEINKEGPEHPRSPENVENRVDHIWVDFPQIRASCDSSEYYAMYLIVLDLLLYAEPLEKVRSERLERIMLASDFSDLRGAPEKVMRLQERIRQLEEIKLQFQINAKYLDRQGWHDRLTIEQDLASCEDELFFLMKAITTSQRKADERSETTGLLRWYLTASELVWHLTREKDEPLIEFQLENAAYERTDNNDGSNYNSMQIEKIRGLNLLPNALYREMIQPFYENSRSPTDNQDAKMLRVHWYMLEAIAGIPVMDHFEVNLFPLKVQLERDVGKRLFSYIFPESDENSTASTNSSTSAIQRPQHSANSSEDTIVTSAASSTTNGMHIDADLGLHHPTFEARLRPTFSLSDRSRPSSTPPLRSRHTRKPSGEHHPFRLFQGSTRFQLGSRTPSITSPITKRSTENLKAAGRKPTQLLAPNLSALHSANSSSDSHRRFALRRSSFKDSRDGHDKKRSDDLTQMMTRASSYMSLAYVKIPSVVLCLSYQGRSERNLEDLHDFVFRMPVVEYRNKTWSNLDLALHLKRDVIKALISHTGAIIGNKLSHRRPMKQQQSKLRGLVTNSTMLSAGGDTSTANSDSSSKQESSPGTGRDGSASPTKRSFVSDPVSSIPRSASYASTASVWSVASQGSAFASGSTRPGHAAVPDRSDSVGDNHGFIHNTFTRHLPHLGHKSRQRNGGVAEEPEERCHKPPTPFPSSYVLSSKSSYRPDEAHTLGQPTPQKQTSARQKHPSVAMNVFQPLAVLL